MVVLMKFVCMENISNLQDISSSDVAYFSKKDKSLWIKFVILTAYLPTKIETLSDTSDSKNAHILRATIKSILSTEMFDVLLFEYV